MRARSGTRCDGIGFEVVNGYDLDIQAMLDKVELFDQRLVGAQVALAYYAGHGISDDGVNYLIPVDAEPNSPFFLQRETISSDGLLRQGDGGARPGEHPDPGRLPQQRLRRHRSRAQEVAEEVSVVRPEAAVPAPPSRSARAALPSAALPLPIPQPARVPAAPSPALPPAAAPEADIAPGPAEIEAALGLGLPDWRRIQQGLQSLGFDPGAIDGRPGPATRNALAKWQAPQGVEATGYLLSGQRASILSALAARQTNANGGAGLSARNDPVGPDTIGHGPIQVDDELARSYLKAAY